MKSDIFHKKITFCFLVKSKKMSLSYIVKYEPKINFCFLAKIKKCHWATLPKMGQKLNFHWKWNFFFKWPRNKTWFFVKKVTFSLLVKWKMPIKPKLSFWPIFGNVAQWHFLTWSENKNDFFSLKGHFLFTERPNLVVKNRLQYYLKKFLDYFVIVAWHGGISNIFFAPPCSPL